ncbi:unnamed protein product [Bursaphelenchus okinawaensis]|uniref:Uncharacterized protein n=1 Tax=Bursaphelenchus okinawaensis TaxID=465554 RepID=A0A811KDC5_9BILA|nr:unnamed protein product [Bursaphelenchus okinawaensis]CAG9102546.1 unnamed protein product [Bursaphelenchus okinawaensis]
MNNALDQSTATSLRSFINHSTSVSLKGSPLVLPKHLKHDFGLTTDKTDLFDATTSVDIQHDDKSINTSLHENLQSSDVNIEGADDKASKNVIKADIGSNTVNLEQNTVSTSMSIDFDDIKNHDDALNGQNRAKKRHDDMFDKSCCTSLIENVDVMTGTRSFEHDTIGNKYGKVDFCGETDDKSWADVKDVSISAGVENDDKSICTSVNENLEAGVGTDRVLVYNRSMETSEIRYWRGESSRCVQTMFPEDFEDDENVMDAETRRKLFSKANQDFSFEDLSNHDVSIQYSLPGQDVCETGVQTLLSTCDLNEMEECAAKSKSTAAMIKITKNDSTTSLDGSDENLNCKKEDVVKQDLIIQTDDSYLKIARRLDEYRTNRSQGIQVYTVGQSSPSHRRKNSRYLAAASNFVRRRSSRSPRVPRYPRNEKTPQRDEEMTTRPELLLPVALLEEYSHAGPSTSSGHVRSEDEISDLSEVAELTTTRKMAKVLTFLEPKPPASGLLAVAQNAQVTTEKAKRKVSWRPKLLSRASTSSLFGNEEKKSVKQISASFDHSTSSAISRVLERDSPRRSSLPVPIKNPIPTGRVKDYVTKHEKGIHSPGTVEGLKKGMVQVIDMRTKNSG